MTDDDRDKPKRPDKFKRHEHQRNASLVAKRMEKEWGVRFDLAGEDGLLDADMATINYIVQTDDGQLDSVIEIKCRENTLFAYPTTIIAKSKYRTLKQYKAKYEVPAYFIVGCPDKIGWIEVDDIDPNRERMGGRPPRPGSLYDIEPIIDIPIETLEEVEWDGFRHV